MKKPIRILFVEDDPEMMAIYTENFLSPDFEVASAPSADRALQILESEKSKFDVVVTDNYMPGMSGLTLLKQIKQKDPAVKLLMVTGYGNWNDHVQSQNAGALRFIDKPVKMADLRLMIERLAG